MTTSVWIVDDDRSIRWVLEKALERRNIAYFSFASAEEAVQALKNDCPTVLVSDIRMPGESGLELLATLRKQHPLVPVIITTAYADLDSAVAAFQGGAFDYLAKPFDIERAVEQILRALHQSETAQQASANAKKSVTLCAVSDEHTVQSHTGNSTNFGHSINPAGNGVSGALSDTDILGKAPAIQALFRAIGRLSQSLATVLITGESGCGKELVARALHRHGSRAQKPFVAINTAAIPHDLLESELFGHERGAFTGAQQQRIGRFEQAQGGTLFLDEIGDMPAELQTRLLRVLSDGHYYRVGGTQLIKADVRLIAATHHPLETRLEEGRFRADLFHRLNVIRLRLPALRERPEDIESLAQHFLQRSAISLSCPVKQLAPAALDALLAFDYPGNVRQLENICHWLTVMTPAQRIDMDDLPAELRQRPHANKSRLGLGALGVDEAASLNDEAYPPGQDWPALLIQDIEQRLASDQPDLMSILVSEFEKIVISTALRSTRGRKIEAAARLGIGRNTITRKLHELKIEVSRLG